MSDDVAIVSPREEIRLLLRGLLKLHHFRVVKEGSTPEALGDLTATGPAILLVDAELDEMGWSEALRALRERRPELRVVLLTSSRSPRTGVQARASGVSALVHRPFAVHELMEAMRGAAPPTPAGPTTAPGTG